MNLSTGLVSPVFHVTFDDHFETLSDHDDYPNKWKQQAHFGRYKVTRKKRLKQPRSEDTAETWNIFNNKAQTDRQKSYDVHDDEDGRIAGDDEHPEEGGIHDPPAEEPEPEPPPPELTAPSQRWSKRHKPTQRIKESGLFGSFF
jgi:hypothetical protein